MLPSGAAPRGSRLESIWQDLRYAARSLARSPGFTAVAVITLALGVGANTAIFAVVNTVMLRPLPYPEPDRLIRIWESNPGKGWPTFSASQPNFLDWRSQLQSFEGLAAQSGTGFTLTSGGDAEIVRAIAVTADLLPTLGIAPRLGRNFRPDEDRPGGHTRVALLTHGFWMRRFGGSPAIVGTTVGLDSQPYEIVGVLPESFATAWGGPRLDLLVPLAPDPVRARGDHRLLVIGRLKAGVTIDQARTEMQALASRLATAYPESNGGWTVALRTFYDWIVPAETRDSLLIMLGAVGLVLLIACGNVASLLLARASARQREFSVRAALGAQRSRIIRQWLVEAMLLGLVAAAAGTALAVATTRLLVAAAPTVLPRLDQMSIDPWVIAFAAGVSLVAAVVFGLGPALHASSARLSESLKDGARSASGGRGRQRLRAGLVIAEVALSVALLIGAGLLIRSFWRVQQVQPGFDTKSVVTMRVTLPRSSYDTSAKAQQFYERLLEAVAALPGVSAAATSNGVPLTAGNTSTEVTLPGKPMPKDSQPSADWRLVSPGYFRALGIPLRGRDFTEADAAIDDKGIPTRAVTIVSEEMARRYWPGEDVLGKTVILHSFGKAPQTIIGVAGDVRSFGLDTSPAPMVYASAMAFPRWNPMNLVVRSNADPMGHIGAIRSALRGIDGTVPLYDVNLVEDLLSESLGSRRFNMYLLACFAAVALLLASIGLFGVLAYLVAQRTRDIGIRMALGANRADVFRLIVGQGMVMTSSGAVLGILGGIAAGRMLRGLLFSVTPTDVTTLVAVPAILLLVALAACAAPARRATRVDPLIALRAE
jgi:putative ABC transport system permease protein